MSTKKNNYHILFIGVILGITLMAFLTIVKDVFVFHIECDDTAVYTTSGDRYCINQTILEGGNK